MDINKKLELLPNAPGCYLMHDNEGKIIYVGKAKNLRKRVKSYFIGAHNEKTIKLISEIRDFEYVITNNEQESLILEINLIKTHLPKYNIRYIDDKSYPYIQITNEEHPRLIVLRTNKLNERAFGPYPNVYSARKTVDLLNKLYPLRKCSNLQKEPCLYYHLGQCLGACLNQGPIDYKPHIKEITRFLKGDNQEVINKIEKIMIEAANNFEYEKAQEYKEMLDHIKLTTEKQIISLNDLKNRDFIAYVSDENMIAIEIMMMRNGSIIDSKQVVFNYVGTAEEAILSYLDQLYETQVFVDELVFSSNFNLEELNLRFKNKVIIPKIGDKKKILDLAIKNAENNLENYFILNQHKSDKKLKIEKAIKDLFGKNYNRIEAFDNSQLFGTAPISALIVYHNYEFQKKEYRKYHLNSAPNDDYEGIREVIYRRYYRLLMENSQLPDLIIIDGGKGQVSSAEEVLSNLNIKIDVIGLKKNAYHLFESLIYQGKEIKLKKNDPLYHFFASISDEVHRYAISFHRSIRTKENYKSPLDKISGLGPKRKQLLLRSFNSITEIKEASFEDLRKLGLPIKLINEIKEVLK